MDYPTWLLWLVATLLAISVPASTLMIIRAVDKVRPKKRRAKPLEFNPYASCEGVLVINEEEALVIARALAEVQMRQRWGKDIDSIV